MKLSLDLSDGKAQSVFAGIVGASIIMRTAIYSGSNVQLTPSEARTIAHALIGMADEIDRKSPDFPNPD